MNSPSKIWAVWLANLQVGLTDSWTDRTRYKAQCLDRRCRDWERIWERGRTDISPGLTGLFPVQSACLTVGLSSLWGWPGKILSCLTRGIGYGTVSIVSLYVCPNSMPTMGQIGNSRHQCTMKASSMSTTKSSTWHLWELCCSLRCMSKSPCTFDMAVLHALQLQVHLACELLQKIAMYRGGYRGGAKGDKYFRWHYPLDKVIIQCKC